MPCQPAEEGGLLLPPLAAEAPFAPVSLSREGVRTPKDGETVGSVWGARSKAARIPPTCASLTSQYTLLTLGEASAHHWPCHRKSGGSFAAAWLDLPRKCCSRIGLRVCVHGCSKKELKENNAVQNKSRIHYEDNIGPLVKKKIRLQKPVRHQQGYFQALLQRAATACHC